MMASILVGVSLINIINYAAILPAYNEQLRIEETILLMAQVDQTIHDTRPYN